jgi:hypothetical protein
MHEEKPSGKIGGSFGIYGFTCGCGPNLDLDHPRKGYRAIEDLVGLKDDPYRLSLESFCYMVKLGLLAYVAN